MSETIYALSSARGVAGVAVIRVSGVQAFACLEALTRQNLPAVRQMRLRSLWMEDGPGDWTLIDQCLAVRFSGPQTFTGEDVVEFHVHGSQAVVAKVFQALADFGLKPAEPGDFTKRAFENGKLDLTQVEGLSDLLAAQTEGQHRQAIAQMSGGLGDKCAAWKQTLVRISGRIEAVIDFPDEDLPDDVLDYVSSEIEALRQEVTAVLARGAAGQHIRDGVRIAIMGPPNVGKSSLLNQLAQRDAAIVSDEAGTTRDVVEVPLNLEGVPVIVSDTAGVREAGHPVEAEGIRRAQAAGSAADIRLWVCDSVGSWDEDFVDVYKRLQKPSDLVIVNKIDLHPDYCFSGAGGLPVFAVSARSGAGLDGLVKTLSERVVADYASGETPLVTRMRQRLVLESFLGHLNRLADGLVDHVEQVNGAGGDISVFAEDLRLSLRDLGRLVGRVDVEDVLDVIFQEFCIGK